MFKAQLKFQKILSYVLLGVFALFFIYSLSIMTHVYRTLYFAYDPDLEIPELGLSGDKVKGAKLFYDMQPFNQALVACAIVMIVVAVTYFLTASNARRKYYVGNYVSAGLIAATDIGIAVYSIIGIVKYRALYLQVDFEELKAYNEPKGLPYSVSTFWFDIGFVVCILLVATAALVIFNAIWKTRLMKKENQLLTGVGGIN